MLAAIELDAGRLDAAQAYLEEARRLAVACAADTTGLDYLLAEVDLLRGDVRPALGRMLDLARAARADRRETAGVGAYRWAAVSAVRMMEHDAAHHGVTEGLRYAAEIEQSYCRHSLASAAAQLAWAEGRWDDAVASARIEVVEPGSARGRLGSRDALGFVAMGRGEVADARALLEPSLEVVRASGEVGLSLNALWGLAEADLVAGEPEAALARCEEALAIANEPGLRPSLVPFVVTGARAAVAARRPGDAERWVERVAAGLESWSALAGPALDHANGLVRLAMGSTGAARAALAAAVDGWDARGRTWEATWARLDLATCLVRMNRHADAIPLLRDVEATAVRLDSAPLRDRARTMLARARSRSADDEPWRPLTVREFEVARLVAKGWTNPEIADELSLAPRTVNAHLEHILGKLGVGRRAEVAAWVSGIDAAAGAATEGVAARR
jgi:DNA-binding CsgD family transcriptional regulator